MKVSVITPCYNAAPYIARTIASVQAQTMPDWEMIVVDDGSTDESAAIVEQIMQVDSRVKLLRKENGGSASARNLGLQQAQGEYIQFLDADDTICPDKFERQIAVMQEQHLDVSYTDYRMQNTDGTIKPPLHGLNESLLHLLIGWGVFGTIPPHCYLYRFAFVQTNHCIFNHHIRQREDWDWHLQIFSHHPIVARMKGYCGALYFLNPTGKTTCGSISKLHYGTCQYLSYAIKHTYGYKRFLLCLRLSTELWSVLFQMLRYKLYGMMDIWHIFEQNTADRLVLLGAILLMPLSIFVYVCSFLYAHYNILHHRN